MTRRGFTLVEVLVVLVILAIAAGAVAPAILAPGDDDDVSAAVRETVKLLGSARREAARRGAEVTLSLDPGTGRYDVRAAGEGASPDSVAAGTLALPAGVTASAPVPRAEFRFDPEGGGWGVPLTLKGSRVAVVEVDRWTGEIRVEAR
ncbi:MAG TPA: GspH/FimT family pseudopilin [Longimicrobium sp.]|nr:GspH/FimT family pseudopilin [Longimicrobium sp.]